MVIADPAGGLADEAHTGEGGEVGEDDLLRQLPAQAGLDGVGGALLGGVDVAPQPQGELIVEAGLGLPLQPAEEEVFPAPAENAVGDDLPHRGVILRLLPGEKGMVVQNELAEVVQMVGDPHLPAQFGFQRLAVYHKNLFHSVHLLSNGFLSV